MKRFFTCLVLAVFLLATIATSYAAQSNDEKIIKDKIRMLFTERGNLVRETKGNLSEFYVANSELLSHELQRPKKIKEELENRWNTKLVDFKPNINVKDVKINGNTAEVMAYEWTFFDWINGDKIVTSGYGVEHNLKLDKINGEWNVVSDDYDEGPLTMVSSPNSTKKLTDKKLADSKLTDDIERKPRGDITPQWWYYYPYNRDNAAYYANSWVYRYANGGIYESYYNNHLYKNYNSSGGDCCNFVSQSMKYGGAPYVNKGTDNTSSWWYDDKGTYPDYTVDDTSSETWRYVPSHKNFMYSNWATSTTGSNLKKGDIVYYDWPNDGISAWWHVTIVTVAASQNNGVALVNSHNNDYYQVRWNYGGTGTQYLPTSVKDSLPVWFN